MISLMNYRALVVAFGFIAYMLCGQNALALRQYRCNGWVQYRPCDELVKPSLLASQRAIPEAAPQIPSPKGKARIISPSFARSGGQLGTWKGRVEGKGDIHLHLHIVRGGKVETVWYMGHVKLNGKSTSFKFITVPPKGSDWSWVIIPSVA